jgi:hypothetical protein
MLFDNAFVKEAYIDGRQLNYWFLGAMLNSLSAAQHMYDRKDIADLYHFIGDIIEFGDFDWDGKNRLTKPENCAMLQSRKARSEQSPSGEKPQPSEDKQNAKPVSSKRAAK